MYSLQSENWIDFYLYLCTRKGDFLTLKFFTYTQFGNCKFQCDKSRNTEFILMCLASAQKNA